MRTAAVLPVKSFGFAKQRLASSLGAGSRQALAQAMFLDVLATLRRTDGIEQTVVVASEASVEFATERDVVVLEDEHGDGQSAATLIGIRWAIAAGYERVLLVPGDTPLLSSDDLSALLATAERDQLAVVIAPDRHHTGTNGLVLTPPDAIEPRFGPGSLERHVEAAQAAGASHGVERVESLLYDVDTSDDLAVVVQVIESSRGVAQRTRGALRQLDRAGARLKQPAGAES